MSDLGIYDVPTGGRVAQGQPMTIRTLPQADDLALQTCRENWPEVQPGDFEHTSKSVWTELSTGRRFRRVHSNPLLGADPGTVDAWYLSGTDGICFLRAEDNEGDVISKAVGVLNSRSSSALEHREHIARQEQR